MPRRSSRRGALLALPRGATAGKAPPLAQDAEQALQSRSQARAFGAGAAVGGRRVPGCAGLQPREPSTEGRVQGAALGPGECGAGHWGPHCLQALQRAMDCWGGEGGASSACSESTLACMWMVGPPAGHPQAPLGPAGNAPREQHLWAERRGSAQGGHSQGQGSSCLRLALWRRGRMWGLARPGWGRGRPRGALLLLPLSLLLPRVGSPRPPGHPQQCVRHESSPPPSTCPALRAEA